MRRVPCLVMEGVEASVWCHPLIKRRQTMGRSRSCDIRVNHPSVSRVHAEIRWDCGSFLIRDLESKNGSFLNRRRVKEAQFDVGDVLRLARVKLGVVYRQIRSSKGSRVESTTHNYQIPAEASGELVGLIDLSSQFALSKAQCRVLHLLLLGISEKEAAARLHLSPHTVHSHAKNIYRVIGVHSRAELLARYLTAPSAAKKKEKRLLKSGEPKQPGVKKRQRR